MPTVGCSGQSEELESGSVPDGARERNRRSESRLGGRVLWRPLDGLCSVNDVGAYAGTFPGGFS